MTRRILAILAVVTVLALGGVAGAVAQQANPCAAKNACAVKPAQNPCAVKGQPAGAESQKGSRDAIGAPGRTASDLAREIGARPTL